MKLKRFLFLFILFFIFIMSKEIALAGCEHIDDGICETHGKKFSEHPLYDGGYYWVPKTTKVVECSTCNRQWIDIVECQKGTPSDDYTSDSTSAHTCSFLIECSNKHCSLNVCTCGRHQYNATCGGGCNALGYCDHCSARYCTICDHTCVCIMSEWCAKPHCDAESRAYCLKCGHSCDGEHKFDTTCPKAHCNGKICSVGNCGLHEDNACGGGHIQGNWLTVDGVHNAYCSVSGCGYIVASHNPIWGIPDVNHISKCDNINNCGITMTHDPVWGEYTIDGLVHKRNCIVTVNGFACSATDSHNPILSDFVKADNGGDESSAEHVKRCTVTDCNLICEKHSWSDGEVWYKLNDTKHKRTCSTCGLIQTAIHKFDSWEAINDDIEDHYKVCRYCLDDNGDKYKLKEKHVDTEYNGRGNGICDLCSKELWRVTKSNLNPTNEDITVKVEMFSDNEDKVKLPVKMIDKAGNELFESSGEYVIKENGTYTFVFQAPDKNVEVIIDNISKTILGNIFVSPNTATTGDVTLTFVTSTQGIDKVIYVGESKESLSLYVSPIVKTVSNNGTYTFYAKDSLGNEATFSVQVNNIVSGFGTVTTTYDVFQNGFIITDILINVNSAWIPANSLESCLNDEEQKSVNKYRVDAGDEPSPIKVKKMMIMDEKGNEVNDSILTTGSYYLRVAIGGSSVFDEEGTYMVEINDVNIYNGNDLLLSLAGKNRIEVVVQSLNDLT